MSVFDCVVAGAGIEGSATAYYLAKNGFRTLLLEQFPLPHSRGSSHGQSRIIRKAYRQPIFAEMMKEAYPMWKDLEIESATILQRTTGVLLMGTNRKKYLASVKSALSSNNIKYKEISPEKIKEIFNVTMYPDSSAIIEPEGGFLKADLALRTFQKEFVKLGGLLLDETQLLSIEPGKIITLHTNRGAYVARNVILCLGPWAGDFLRRMGLQLPLKPIRTSVGYYKEKLPFQYGLGRFLPFLYDTESTHFYGIPSNEYPGLVKVALHNGPDIEPDKRDQVKGDWVMRTCNQFVRDVFPGLEPVPSIVEHCIYTNTPDEYFILDRHPNHPNVIVGAGFSGHGFKLAPVVGKILGDLAMKNPPTYDLSYFRIDRFHPKASL